MPVILTTEQISYLAPSQHFLKAGQTMSAPGKWLTLGRIQQTAWGEYPYKDKPPFQVIIGFPELTFACSCASRRFPCSHVLGLLFMLIEKPADIPDEPEPDWVNVWLIRSKETSHQEKRAPE